jgi:hypothetical protein
VFVELIYGMWFIQVTGFKQCNATCELDREGRLRRHIEFRNRYGGKIMVQEGQGKQENRMRD